MKEIIIPNYNNKFSGTIFLHIAKTSGETIPSAAFPIPIMIKESETAKPFAAEVIDIARLFLFEVGSVASYASHGMDREQFIEFIIARDPKIELTDKFAVYIYRKK